MAIYVLESHPLMCHAISNLLRRLDPSQKVVEIYAYSKLQEAMLINGQPDAFLLDPVMTGINGRAGIKQIKNNYPTTPLILFSSIPSEEAEKSCLNAGADLYIEKTATQQVIFDLIRNHLALPDKQIANTTSPRSAEGLVKLSQRQKQLLVLVDAGLSNTDIANKLDISSHTVKVHLWRFYKKLGISSRTQLIKFSRDNGYL